MYYYWYIYLFFPLLHYTLIMNEIENIYLFIKIILHILKEINLCNNNKLMKSQVLFKNGSILVFTNLHKGKTGGQIKVCGYLH